VPGARKAADMARATLMMPRVSRLFVLWSDPADGTRHVVGHLAREDDGTFAFSYVPDLQPILQRGFRLLSEFPEKKLYRARYLFPTFAQRIPVPSRPDFKRILDSWGVQDKDDHLEILGRSGGIQVTDRLELSEYRSESDPLTRALVFRIAGEKRHPGGDLLQPGDPVLLARDRQNAFDPSATLVLVREGKTVGYVPRQYSKMIAGQLDAGHSLEATALRRLVVPPERGRWQVEVRRPS